MLMTVTILDRWHITADELTQVVDQNPSLRGFLLGYIAEYQLKKLLLSDTRITNIHKFDDHDRSRGKKNDLCITYKNLDFTIEVKSLQTASVRTDNGIYRGNFQCDASDSRTIPLPNGERIKTTCLEVGGFDIVAVNLFAFQHQWHFGFALNIDLPRSTHKEYTPEQRQYLLATSMKITWPMQPPFVTDPSLLLDRLIAERASHVSTTLPTDPISTKAIFERTIFDIES
jgi:hypothetical protein